jgi:uncharacterized protein YciI
VISSKNAQDQALAPESSGIVFGIWCKDNITGIAVKSQQSPEKLIFPARDEFYAQHLQYQKSSNDFAWITKLLSGPLISDDRNAQIGSFFLVKTADKKNAVNWVENDPLFKNKVWISVNVEEFSRASGKILL